MDQEANAGDHGEHGQRKTIQHRVKTDVEITHRHPGPQRYADRLLPFAKKSTPTNAVTSAARPTDPIPTVAERFSDQRPRRMTAEQSQSMAEEWLRQACSSTQLTY